MVRSIWYRHAYRVCTVTRIVGRSYSGDTIARVIMADGYVTDVLYAHLDTIDGPRWSSLVTSTLARVT